MQECKQCTSTRLKVNGLFLRFWFIWSMTRMLVEVEKAQPPGEGIEKSLS